MWRTAVIPMLTARHPSWHRRPTRVAVHTVRARSPEHPPGAGLVLDLDRRTGIELADLVDDAGGGLADDVHRRAAAGHEGQLFAGRRHPLGDHLARLDIDHRQLRVL